MGLLNNIVTLVSLVISCVNDGYASSSASTSCLTETSLVVNDSASAGALAEMVDCAGGVFHVDWRGDVEVNQTINLSAGTCLNVTGANSDAAITGGGSEPLFAVNSACLDVTNMRVSGRTIDGPWINASRSIMSFERTSFVGAGWPGAQASVDWDGGAFHLEDSTVSWRGKTSFSNNTFCDNPDADTGGYRGGGAIHATNSTLRWEGDTSFYNNTSIRSLIRAVDSTLTWEGATSFSDSAAPTVPRNASSYFNGGGAIWAENSVLKWEGVTSFSNNVATDGGYIYAVGSTLTWGARASFFDNEEAMYLSGSTASWRGETLFFGNTGHFGGALRLHASTASWQGETNFSHNIAVTAGGATHIGEGSIASWEAEASFSHNSASAGGAVALLSNSRASWEAQATFSNNSASGGSGASSVDYNYYYGEGGAMHISGGQAFWGAKTSFSDNNADSRGGALSFAGGNATFNETVSFVNNSALGFGGAVSLESRHWFDDEFDASLTLTNKAEFIQNKCNTGGGGLAMDGLVSAQFAENKTLFSENKAGVAGGGVHVANVAAGPQFSDVRFTSNSAEFGGGVYLSGSGTDHDSRTFNTGNSLERRTKFDRCEFVDNTASSDGGAVSSSFGQDYFVGSNFEGNNARFGGALNLAGTDSSVSDCTFVDNSSEEEEGPAVSNRGLISSFSGSSFSTNVVVCASGEYRETSIEDNQTISFEFACEACDMVCSNCGFDFNVSSCTEELDHTTSAGGNTTMEGLEIDSGYWRYATGSKSVLACYNKDACAGGISGEAGFCHPGYEGPYCAVCSDGYTPTLEYVCDECSDNDGRWALVVIISVLSVVALAVFVSYMVSGEWEGASRGIAARVAPYIPLQSLKIILVAWQILTQFSEVANVTYPGVYQEFLDSVKVLNFDLSRILSAGCVINVDFHDRLLMSTIAPLVGMTILGATYAVATRRNRSSEDALSHVRQKHLSMVLLLTFVVYSSVSSTLFQTFGPDEVDEGVVYLRADYRIDFNDSKHQAFMVYAGFMLVLYTAGIPMFYATLLFKNRKALVKVGRERDPRLKPTTDLWKVYKPDRFFYELVECGRRILLAGVVVFIYPNTASQVAVTIMIAVFFIFVSEILAPYASPWDTWISRIGHGIVFTSMYVALLLKVDVSDEHPSSQKVFDIILVSAHACMVLAVVVEAAAMACSVVWREREDAYPRIHHGQEVSFAIRLGDQFAEDDVKNTPITEEVKEC